MTEIGTPAPILTLDSPTRALVRLSARIAGAAESDVRLGIRETIDAGTPSPWVEELLLQSYLFCGFPRCLNAMREWRRTMSAVGNGLDASSGESGAGTREELAGEFQQAGERTCARVYGRFYEKLRHNIVALHPELDRWMIVEGYGKVLSRPGLDLGRRELCIVAACVASGQDRQLHSHLHGARNVGVPDAVILSALGALDGIVEGDHLARATGLWAKVRSQ